MGDTRLGAACRDRARHCQPVAHVIQQIAKVARQGESAHGGPQRQYVAGFAGGEVDPDAALGSLQFNDQTVARIALQVADHKVRALALAVREQINENHLQPIQQVRTQFIFVVVPYGDKVGRKVDCIVEIEIGVGRLNGNCGSGIRHWVCSWSSRALNQLPSARTQ